MRYRFNAGKSAKIIWEQSIDGTGSKTSYQTMLAVVFPSQKIYLDDQQTFLPWSFSIRSVKRETIHEGFRPSQRSAEVAAETWLRENCKPFWRAKT